MLFLTRMILYVTATPLPHQLAFQGKGSASCILTSYLAQVRVVVKGRNERLLVVLVGGDDATLRAIVRPRFVFRPLSSRQSRCWC